ncbi:MULTISPECIES: low affinity iron permease family protein [unclassified Brevundimonas]|uniref:low affinity iron permease family protein n=1 Tax=unclassified Brevundimonas TaxID=2622653 RepID=UPI003F90FB57
MRVLASVRRAPLGGPRRTQGRSRRCKAMERLFVKFSNAAASLAGRPWTFVVCLALVLIWGLTGPLFHFNESWQLVINTGTTIVTFLMVFLIQNTQNRDGAAIHAKLDELIHAVEAADERFIGLERLTDRDLKIILQQVEERARRLQGSGLPAIRTRAEDGGGEESGAATDPSQPLEEGPLGENVRHHGGGDPTLSGDGEKRQSDNDKGRTTGGQHQRRS